MTPLAVALVLVSAVAHALWNFLAKRLGDDARGLGFPWVLSAVSATLYAPIGLVVVWQAGPARLGGAVGWIAVSATIHVIYLLALQRGYRSGDFSVVYPVARGSGPLLAAAGAILLLGERASWATLTGASLVGGGVLMLAGVGGLRLGRAGLGWALLTGVTIGAYTLWDAAGIRRLAVPVLLYDWMGHVIRTAMLTPAGPKMFREEVRPLWRRHRRTLLQIGALSPLAYILVLMAVRISPVARVAPMREIGILVGAWLGVGVLQERERRRRVIAAALVCAGVLLLATT